MLDEDATVEPENVHRLLVLGAANVGKTSIVQLFLGHAYNDKYMPTVEDFHRKVRQCDRVETRSKMAGYVR